MLQRTFHGILLGLLALRGLDLTAQTPKRVTAFDLALTYAPQRSLQAFTDERFWLQGGAVELGAVVWRGWGAAAELAGLHAGSIASSGVPVSELLVGLGPRYRWGTEKRISVYGQGLLGEVNGFSGLYPTTSGSHTDAHGLAAQLSGGVDVKLAHRLAVRALEVGWVHTRLPNAAGNIQNNLSLGAGLVFRFSR